MEVDPGPSSGLGDQSELLSLVSQLLDDTTSHTIIQTYRADLPELLHHTAQFVLRPGGQQHEVDRFLVLCGKLVRFNRNLVQHLETWLGQVTPPWAGGETEPSMKRCRLETSLDTELMASCYWLLSHCSSQAAYQLVLGRDLPSPHLQ